MDPIPSYICITIGVRPYFNSKSSLEINVTLPYIRTYIVISIVNVRLVNNNPQNLVLLTRLFNSVKTKEYGSDSLFLLLRNHLNTNYL